MEFAEIIHIFGMLEEITRNLIELLVHILGNAENCRIGAIRWNWPKQYYRIGSFFERNFPRSRNDMGFHDFRGREKSHGIPTEWDVVN